MMTIGWRLKSIQEFWEMDGGILFNGNTLEESERNGQECEGCAMEVWWQQGFYTTKPTRHVQI